MVIDTGNTGKGNIPERDLWETKQELWDKLDKHYNFTFDCCATLENSKCQYSSDNFESIKTFLPRTCWMNPPFSKAMEMFKHFFKVAESGVCIYRCDNMETKVWQDIILKNADWILIPKGRIAYTPFETGNMRKGMGSRFPSALIGFNVDTPKDIDGTILLIKHSSSKN